MKIKNNNGITLIVLVITIIILLILAGVSINILVGDNGILKQAQNATIKNKEASAMEQIQLEVSIAYNENGIYSSDIAKNNLEKNLNAKVNKNRDNSLTVSYQNCDFIVSNKGKVLTMYGKVIDENPGILSGDGTEEKPYLIESIEDLLYFSVNSKINNNYYENKHVSLATSLDFQSNDSYVNPNDKYIYDADNDIYVKNNNGTNTLKELLSKEYGWIPIYDFKGVFDGNNYSIKNFYLSRNESSYSFYGLFRNNNGTIKNLNMKNCNIIANGTANYGFFASICGLNYGTIENCFVTGKINSNYKNNIISGISAQNDGLINLCMNYINISGQSTQCGGIVGQNHKSITNCGNNGSFNMNNIDYLGGISGLSIGTAYEDSKISGCYNKGEIYSINSGAVGGIVGEYDDGNIIDCYNANKIELTTNKSMVNVGGIVATPAMTGIYGLYNIGIIKAEDGTFNIGGIANFNKRYAKGIYNEGNIFASNTSIVGAISGKKVDGMFSINNVKYCCNIGKAFADDSLQENLVEKLANPISKSELLVLLENAYDGITWKEDVNNINNGYPILYWQ